MISDTILAIATPPGESGVGILRLSGSMAVQAVEPYFKSVSGKPLSKQEPRYLAHGSLYDGQGHLLDELLCVRFAAPHSFTGEAVVELQAHGGTFHLQSIQKALLEANREMLPPLRLARPGEFTQRAFINGKLDLTRAEAIADLIHSGTALARDAAARQLAGHLQGEVDALRQGLVGLLANAEAACDFPDEEEQLAPRARLLSEVQALRARMQAMLATAHTGRMLTQGVHVAILGQPNAGKSSLMNALLGAERSIVSAEPGTTRDYIEARFQVQGFPVVLVDTAGLREAQGVEAEGVRRSLEQAAKADLLMVILDQSTAFDPRALEPLRDLATDALFIFNKSDLSPVWDVTALRRRLQTLRPAWASADELRKRVLVVSARTRSGLEALKARILATALEGRAAPMLEQVLLTQARHEQAMRRAEEALGHVEQALHDKASADLFAGDARSALDALGEITGTVSRAEILDEIFKRFCIGK
jgi:tRNA modification GTPase